MSPAMTADAAIALYLIDFGRLRLICPIPQQSGVLW
jgi:hypothetical protein